jgi:hypothetical protein
VERNDAVLKYGPSPMGVVIEIVPYFIEQALVRNNLELKDISNYKKIREVVAFDDIKDWALIHTDLKVRGTDLGQQMFGNWFFQNMKYTDSPDSQKYELSEIENMWYSPTGSSDGAFGRLADDLQWENTPLKAKIKNTIKKSFETAYYRFVILEDRVLIILYPGFMSRINKCDEFTFDFLRDSMKSLYKRYSIVNANSTKLFNSYITALYLKECYTDRCKEFH